uniref:BZIP domain-containing protein n=1 Tax=Populus davidiana TaxID=266767 RepID=A0A6M2FA80_9ROSI
MSRPKFLDDQNFLVGCGTGDELNNGLVNDPIPRDHYSAQLEEHGANKLLSAAANHAHFQPVNTQINHNQSVQPNAYLHQFGTATSYAMEHGLVNVQLPHRWDQPEGAIYTVNPSISAQMNLPPLAIPGSSQSSNISNDDHEKRLRKQESDRKSRAKKEQMRRENEERLVKVTEENNELRKYNATLKDGEVEMKRKLKNFEQKVSYFEKEVRHLNNKLKGQNTKVDVLSEKLVASSETNVLVEENKRLKRKNELLMTRLNNPDIMQKVELDEENEKLKREVKRLRIINDALCDKMNNDEH